MNKEPKTVSNVSCRLFDLRTTNPKEYHKYTEPIYTKLDGKYGYLSIDGNKVLFYWYDNSNENVCYDDVSEKFRVEYYEINSMCVAVSETRIFI
jgi:hypothetical protein